MFIERLFNFFGYIYVRPEFIEASPKILHLSDTPYSTFNAIKRALCKIQPEIIVHTGDLVDNIKIGIQPNKMALYHKNVKKIVNILDNSSAKRVIIITGNHDDYQYLKKLDTRLEIYQDKKNLDLLDHKFLLIHDIDTITTDESYDYVLYGHNYDGKNNFNSNFILNGLDAVHLIYPKLDTFYSLNYPYGTSSSRQDLGSIGT